MTSGSQYLTKSLFQRFSQCPRKLAYAFSGYEANESTGFLQNLAEDGKKIGVYSRIFYPGSEITTGSSEDAVEKTRSLLKSHDKVTLFEAAFRSKDCLIRADIVEKTGANTLNLIEVKAKSWDSRKLRDDLILTNAGGIFLDLKLRGSLSSKEGLKLQKKKGAGLIRADFLKYVRDVAFQKFVVQECYPEYLVNSFLLLPDKSLRNSKIPNLFTLFDEDRLTKEVENDILSSNEMLLTKVEISDIVEMIIEDGVALPEGNWETFKEHVEWLGALASETTENRIATTAPAPIGSVCRECEFRGKEAEDGFDQCWKEVTELEETRQNMVVDLFHGGKTLEKLVVKKKFRFADVHHADIGVNAEGKEAEKKKIGISRKERQWLQMKSSQPVVLERHCFAGEMEQWEYPYNFIDMETTTPVLPYTTGKHPYQHLAFQFSHHILHSDGKVEHASEFIHAKPGHCPNVPFLNALADCLKDTQGTVFRWGAHENTMVNSLLAKDEEVLVGCHDNLAYLKSILQAGDRAMVDLMAVAEKCYYVQGSGGSSSIKKLLRPSLQYSEHLREIYGQPTYTSNNFTDMQWWQEEESDEGPVDPYKLLGSYCSKDRNATGGISHGGDAIKAYGTLQREDLTPEERGAIEKSLLRYCELDTLAMVMIMQALQGFYESINHE